MTARTCPECVRDGGWHWTDDLEPKAFRCPNWSAAEGQAAAVKLAAEAHAQQFLAAKAIITDAAQTMPEFNANLIRHMFEQAQITDRQVIGAAFTALANSKRPPIEATGRFVQSTDPATRHRIAVWRSTIYSNRRTA